MIDYFRNHKYRPRKPWWEFSLSKQEQARCLSYIAGKPDAVSERFAALKLTEKELHKHTMIETIPFSLAHYRNRQEFFSAKRIVTRILRSEGEKKLHCFPSRCQLKSCQNQSKEEFTMNDMIKLMKQHRSYRSFQPKPLPDKYLEEIVAAAQSAPSWINGQQVSIICVREQKRKAKLAELAGHQAHVEQAPVFLVFCADFHRASLAGKKHDTSLEALEQVDALLVGATDVGLAMSNTITACESLQLGTVPIGGIRKNSLAVVDLLELPKYVFPVAGLCIGYPMTDPGQKPRLPASTVLHHERYEPVDQHALNDYDQTIRTAQGNHSGVKSTTWTERVASFYEKPYYDNIANMLKQQGFHCKDICGTHDE